MKDYEITLTVRNNFFLTAMRKKGFWTAAALSRATGVGPSQIGKFLNLRKIPLMKDGCWLPSVERIALALECTPFDLFPPRHIDAEMSRNVGVVTMAAEEMTTLIATVQAPNPPDRLLEKTDALDTLSKALQTLPPRLEHVLRQRYGIDGEAMTLEAIAKEQGLTRERIRQMESAALRKLRHRNAGLIAGGKKLIDVDAVA